MICLGWIWGLLSFMYFNGHISPQIWGLAAIISLNKFSIAFLLSSPSWTNVNSISQNRTPVMWIVFHLMASHNSCSLLSLFIILFFFFLLWVILRDLSSSFQKCFFFFCSIELVLKLSVTFFIPFIVFFGSRISVWFFFNDFYLLVEHLILFPHCFFSSLSCLSVFSWILQSLK